MSNVFLTGATGFVGAFLLDELLRRTDVGTVVCLVRARDAAGGLERLRTNLEVLSIERADLSSRVRVVAGDLGEARFGLSPADFDRLSESVDLILHAGSEVCFRRPYGALARANVGGTNEVIRLAFRGPRKPIHYVSSLAVADTERTRGARVDERFRPDSEHPPLTGYAQTKWIAEELLARAHRRGVPVAIYRCDDVAGHSVTGEWNDNGPLWQWLWACRDLGVAPDVDVPLGMLPVDVVARALVALTLGAPADGRTYHIRSPRPVAFQSLLDTLHATGFAPARVPYAVWKQALRAAADRPAVKAVAPLFEEQAFAGQRPSYDATQADEALSALGLRIDPIDPLTLWVYAHAWREAGLIAA